MQSTHGGVTPSPRLHQIDGGPSIYNLTVTFCGIEPIVEVVAVQIGQQDVHPWGNHFVCVTSEDLYKLPTEPYRPPPDDYQVDFSVAIQNLGTDRAAPPLIIRAYFDDREAFFEEVGTTREVYEDSYLYNATSGSWDLCPNCLTIREVGPCRL